MPGKITKCKGPLSFDVLLDDEIVRRRHQGKIRKRADEVNDTRIGVKSSTDVAAEEPELNDRAQDEQDEEANNSVVGEGPRSRKITKHTHQ